MWVWLSICLSSNNKFLRIFCTPVWMTEINIVRHEVIIVIYWVWKLSYSHGKDRISRGQLKPTGTILLGSYRSSSADIPLSWLFRDLLILYLNNLNSSFAEDNCQSKGCRINPGPGVYILCSQNMPCTSVSSREKQWVSTGYDTQEQLGSLASMITEIQMEQHSHPQPPAQKKWNNPASSFWEMHCRHYDFLI